MRGVPPRAPQLRAPFIKSEPRRLLLSILKRRGGWGVDDVPLELEGAEDLEALLRLWRGQGEAAR